jgi:alpha-1,2-mannosyltransferase
MIDSYFPGAEISPLEPAYVQDTETWEPVACEPFLDQARTSTIARLIWIPQIPGLPAKFQRHWGQYCLLRRRKTPEESPKIGGS